MHSYAPLQQNFAVEDLMECDTLLTNEIRTTCGLCKNDAKHPLF